MAEAWAPHLNGTTPFLEHKLPFEVNFTVKENYLFLGFLNEEPLQMVEDPAFTSIPLAFSNLVLYRISDGPCGAFDWVCPSAGVYLTSFRIPDWS
jgi:hypothetical protein